MSDGQREFQFRSIALPALIPSLLFAIGEGAIIPIIPIIADDLGAGLALAGFISAMVMVGELVGDIPSGWIVSRIGERTAMIGASALSMLGVALCLLSTAPWMLGTGIFLLGLSAATFALARHAFMTTFVPIRYRARALSTLGGTFRAGWFIGPFIAAGIIAATGNAHLVFWVHLLAALSIIVILIVMPDPEQLMREARAGGATPPPQGAVATHGHRVETEGEEFVASEAHGLFRTIWSFRGVLATVGTGVAIVGALRAARTVILPLWAVSLGVDPAHTALIIGLGGAMDFALFYTSGQIMDRYGRLWSAVPSLLGLGSGLLILSVSHDFVGAVWWFIGATVFTGLANGIGSGILMTVGADLAPKDDPAPFLGAFRFTGDFGTAVAPLAIAGVIAVLSLPIATAGIGILGFIGAGILARYLPRYSPHARRR